MSSPSSSSNMSPSWIPGWQVNTQIRQGQQLTSNWKYRRYLQQHANDIMSYNTQLVASETQTPAPQSFSPVQESGNTPYLYKSCLSTAQPTGYENSDLKEYYLTKQRLHCQMVSPEIRIEKGKH